MRGTNHLLALTTTVDEVTGEVKPLFSFPVQVCKGLDDAAGAAQFENAAPSGATYTTKYVDDATGEAFESADKIKGVRVGDEFKPIDAEAIKAIDEGTKVTTMTALGSLDLDAFRVTYGDRICGRYFLQVPKTGGNGMAYRLTYEALLAENRAVVVKRTPKTRQALCVIYPDADEGCLMMVHVEFAAIVRQADEQVTAFQTVEVQAKMVKQARQIVKGMADGGEVLDAEVDEAVALRRELMEKAVAGEAIPTPEPVAATNKTEDLAAVLAASLEG